MVISAEVEGAGAEQTNILSTRIMRFRKPTKLGCSSASWLRHEVRANEWVAKTWRYFVSRVRWTDVFTFCWGVLPRYIVEREGSGASMAVAVAMSVMVAMVG